jgi:hypothetical protein
MSNKTRFTPGPWRCSKGGWISDKSGNAVIEYAGCGSHKADYPNGADRHLIAAAPDLYAALQNLVDFCDFFKSSDQYQAALYALAKARGDA